MIKFETLDLTRIQEEEIEIRGVKVSNEKSECSLTIEHEAIDKDYSWDEELDSEEMLKRVRKSIMDKKAALICEKPPSIYEIDVPTPDRISIGEITDNGGYRCASVLVSGRLVDFTSCINGDASDDELLEKARKDVMDALKGPKSKNEEPSAELKEQADALVEGAQPGLAITPEALVRKNGFVRGVVMKRTDAFKGDRKYGIFTGEIDRNADGILLKCSDGKAFLMEYCTTIDDVDKEIIRTIRTEQERIRDEAEKFCQEIDKFFSDLIYG